MSSTKENGEDKVNQVSVTTPNKIGRKRKESIPKENNAGDDTISVSKIGKKAKNVSDDETPSPPKVKATRKKKTDIAEVNAETEVTVVPTPKKKTGHAGSEPHVRDIVAPHPLDSSHKYLKVISWNVCGMKALKDKNLSLLTKLVDTHKPDILCLQETKLQTSMVDDYRDILPGYESHWSCSVEKKGYSGTAVFLNKATINTKTAGTKTAGTAPSSSSAAPSVVAEAPKKKQAKLNAFFKKAESEAVAAASVEETSPPVETTPPADPVAQLVRVSFDFEDEKKMFSGEGRTITVELDRFVVVACYVPNSGEGLVRLDYRVDQWDKHMKEYLSKHAARKPVVYAGDLNVGHLDLDIHNPEAKHIVKQAGLTVRERQAHSELLGEGGEFMDSLRYFYPDARGQFTYWSMRTFARPVNKGIRLDYFVCSRDMYAKDSSSSSSSSDTSSNTTSVESETITEIEPSTSAVQAKRRSVSAQDIPTPGVYDSYSLPEDTVGCSDHAPVVLVVSV